MESGIAEPVVQDPPAPAAPAAPEPAPAPSDPFAVDEAQFASFTPEQRGAITPVLENWKKKAMEQVEAAKTGAEESHKPVREKAAALDNLVKHPAFQQWWQMQQQQMSQGQPAGTQSAVSQAKPQDFATPQEWSEAVMEASNGSAEKLQTIQARMFATMATPFVQQFTRKQKELDTRMEMKDLMEAHPDYKELDAIGVDPKTKEGISLLGFALNWAESQGKPLVEGYQLAKKWASAMKAGAQAQALGIVAGKKDAVTAGPGASTNAGTVIYVDTQDELIRKSMQATMEGRKDVRFEIKKK